jgi:hypothetical protein
MARLAGWVALLGLLALVGPLRVNAEPASCARAGALEFICGPKNVEDLVGIPGRTLLIGSGLASDGPAPGHLYVIDTRTRRADPLKVDFASKAVPAYASCPAPIVASQLHPHGIGLRAISAGHAELYVVNHGGRESIEIFDLDTKADVAAKWIGCVVLPDGASGNGVAPLGDGGFVATKFFDIHAGEWIAQLTEGKQTGTAYVWHPGSGFKEIPGTVASGDNGIETSADFHWAFINIWPEKRVLRVDLTGAEPPKSIALDFMPDNVHRAPDGSLLVGGHISDMHILMACKRIRCPVDWAIARIDPKTFAVNYLLWEKGTAEFEGVTGAIQMDDALWLSLFRGDRVAQVKLPTAPLKPTKP